MKLLIKNNIIIVAWLGSTPDWAIDDTEKAGTDGYELLDVAFADYLEGDDITEWDISTGTRLVERYIPTEEDKINSGEILLSDWIENKCNEITKEWNNRLNQGFTYSDGNIYPLDLGAQAAYNAEINAILIGAQFTPFARTIDNRNIEFTVETFVPFAMSALQAGIAINQPAWTAKDTMRNCTTYLDAKSIYDSYFN